MKTQMQQQSATGWSAVWTKTPFANLWRYKPSGVYYVKAHIGGRLVRRSLKTGSLEKAQIFLARLMEEERAGKAPTLPQDGATFGNLSDIHRTRIEASQRKPRGKEYKLDCLDFLKVIDPDLWTVRASDLTDARIEDAYNRARSKYGPTQANGILTELRAVCELAVEFGLLRFRPGANLHYQRVPVTEPKLPTAKQFAKMLKQLETVPHRKHGANAIRLLLLTGARISAVQQLRPEHCHFDKNEVELPAIKYDCEPTRLPMFPALRKLLKKLCADYDWPGRPLCKISNPKKALAKACDEAGIPRLSPHKLRHYFATRCLQSGVDVRTVAAWLGHRDGGALLLKRYAHLLSDHSQRMAKKVRF